MIVFRGVGFFRHEHAHNHRVAPQYRGFLNTYAFEALTSQSAFKLPPRIGRPGLFQYGDFAARVERKQDMRHE